MLSHSILIIRVNFIKFIFRKHSNAEKFGFISFRVGIFFVQYINAKEEINLTQQKPFKKDVD